MLRQIKFMGVFGLAPVVVLIVSATAGKPLPDIPLRVTFSPVLASTITPGEYMNCNILNDVQGLPYQSSSDKKFANSVKIVAPNTGGGFIMFLNKNNSQGRYVKIEFDEGTFSNPGYPDLCSTNPYFLQDKVLDFSEANLTRFKTMYRYSETIVDGKRKLENTKVWFNFTKMQKGASDIVATVFDFYVSDDPGTPSYNESSDIYSLSFQYPARVKCDDFDGDGALEWVMSPVQEDFYDVNEGDKYYPDGSVFRGLYSNYYMRCLHGWLKFPFEMTLDPIK